MPKLISYKPITSMPSELGIISLLTAVTIGGYLLFRRYKESSVPNETSIDDMGRSSGVPLDKQKIYDTEMLRAKYYAFSLVVSYVQQEADFANMIRPSSQEITKYLYKHEKELEQVNQIRYLSGNTAKSEKASKILAQTILKEINQERKLSAMMI